MTQKVLKVGTSAAVTIPKKSLAELGLTFGDTVSLSIDHRNKKVTIQPARQLGARRNEKIAKLTIRFIERYRKDLEKLAKK